MSFPNRTGNGYEHWKITERIHSGGKVFVNLVRKNKVKTVRVR